MELEFNIDELLWQKRTNIKRLAEDSGLSYRTVHAIAHNRRTRTDLHTLSVLATALGVQPGELLREKKKPRP